MLVGCLLAKSNRLVCFTIVRNDSFYNSFNLLYLYIVEEVYPTIIVYRGLYISSIFPYLIFFKNKKESYKLNFPFITRASYFIRALNLRFFIPLSTTSLHILLFLILVQSTNNIYPCPSLRSNSTVCCFSYF